MGTPDFTAADIAKGEALFKGACTFVKAGTAQLGFEKSAPSHFRFHAECPNNWVDPVVLQKKSRES